MVKKREVLKSEKRSLTVGARAQPVNDREGVLSFTFISRENDGVRHDWWSGESYVERLDPSGAKTDRLRTFFKDHQLRVDNAIGKIENVRVEDDELVGDVVFGKDEDSQRIYEKYRDGLLSDVSVQYQINAYDVVERDADLDLVTVTDYDVFEVSAVAVGFDIGAKKRNEGGFMPEEVKARIAELEKVAERSKAQEQELTKLRGDYEAALTSAKEKEAELMRRNEINEFALEKGVDAEFTRTFIEDSSKTITDFMRALLDKKAEEVPDVTGGTRPNETEMRAEIAEAITVRLGGKSDVKDNQFMGASMLDIARALTNYNGYSRNELAERAMVTTDFPLLLIESGNRVLEQEWDAQENTFRRFVTEVDLPDFRLTTDITRGAAGGRLDKIVQDGELKEKQLAENGESWKLSSYGNKFVLTREMLINDDLGAFNDMLSDLVFLSGNTANGLVYDLIRKVGEFAGYTMSDGLPIFDDDVHKNIVDTAFGTDALSAGRLAMRKQLGIDGKTPLNIKPRYLIVSPELEEQARIILESPASIEDGKNSSVVNLNYRSLELIVDAEVQGADEWYMLAPRRTVKVGYLNGTGRRPVLQMSDSSLMRTEFEGIFDFGVMAEDYRGMVKGGVNGSPIG